MIMKFKGLIKGNEEPKVKIVNDELYLVIPKKAKVKQRFLGGCIIYRIEDGNNVWYFKVRLGTSALGDWVEPLKPDEWNEMEKLSSY